MPAGTAERTERRPDRVEFQREGPKGGPQVSHGGHQSAKRFSLQQLCSGDYNERESERGAGCRLLHVFEVTLCCLVLLIKGPVHKPYSSAYPFAKQSVLRKPSTLSPYVTQDTQAPAWQSPISSKAGVASDKQPAEVSLASQLKARSSCTSNEQPSTNAEVSLASQLKARSSCTSATSNQPQTVPSSSHSLHTNNSSLPMLSTCTSSTEAAKNTSSHEPQKARRRAPTRARNVTSHLPSFSPFSVGNNSSPLPHLLTSPPTAHPSLTLQAHSPTAVSKGEHDSSFPLRRRRLTICGSSELPQDICAVAGIVQEMKGFGGCDIWHARKELHRSSATFIPVVNQERGYAGIGGEAPAVKRPIFSTKVRNRCVFERERACVSHLRGKTCFA